MVVKKNIFTNTQKLILLYISKYHRKRDVSIDEIKHNIKASEKTIIINIKKMLEKDYIKEVKKGNKIIYKTSSSGKLKLISIYSKKTIKDVNIKKAIYSLTKSQNMILKYLYDNKTRTTTMSSMDMRIPLSGVTIHKHVNILINKGYVKKKPLFGMSANKYVYYITDAGVLVVPKKKRMQKRFRKELADSFRELSNSSNEYSIAIDFERHLKNPERFVVVRGSKSSTKVIRDFEMYGHTHPNRGDALPSAADLRNKRVGEPTFIVAGASPHKIIILEIKNLTQYNKWKKSARDLPRNSHAYSRNAFIKKYGKDDLYLRHNVSNSNGRDVYLELTGVKITPYYDNMQIDLRDDIIKEKTVPTVDTWSLNDWDERGLL